MKLLSQRGNAVTISSYREEMMVVCAGARPLGVPVRASSSEYGRYFRASSAALLATYWSRVRFRTLACLVACARRCMALASGAAGCVQPNEWYPETRVSPGWRACSTMYQCHGGSPSRRTAVRICSGRRSAPHATPFAALSRCRPLHGTAIACSSGTPSWRIEFARPSTPA